MRPRTRQHGQSPMNRDTRHESPRHVQFSTKSPPPTTIDRTAQLPLEILPLILSHLQWRTRDLASCCLVSSVWQHYAQPLLYSRLFLRDQRRLIKVFQTLTQNTTLARLVQILEIRVFPFGLRAKELEQLEADVLHTLQEAVHLKELYWTRTGSLTDRVIPFLPSLPKLQTLELTGSARFYTPANITRYLLQQDKTPSLQHLSVILPDRSVADELPRWCQAVGARLISLNILCQHSAFVNDDTLKQMAPFLTGLKRLSIAGCKAVTADGILSLLKASQHGIQDLAIEGLAIHPSTFQYMAKYLSELKLLSLTFPRQNLCPAAEFWQSLGTFVEDLPKLEEFTHYTSSWNTPKGMYTDTLDSDEDPMPEEAYEADDALRRENGHATRRYNGHTPQEYRRHELESHAESGRPIVREPKLSTSFLTRLLRSRGERLTKIRIHGIVATMEQVAMIARDCANVRDLVIHLYEGDWTALQAALSNMRYLRSLHILSSLYSDVYISEEQLRAIAAACSTDLRQIGFRNRVWLVERHLATDAVRAIDQQHVASATNNVIRSATSSTENISQIQNEVSNSAAKHVTILEDGRYLFLRRWDMSAGTFPEVLLVVRACECFGTMMPCIPLKITASQFLLRRSMF